MRVAIVVPTFNEISNVRVLFGCLRSVMPDAAVVFIDDGSPDGTGVELDRLANEFANVTVIHRPGRAGIGSAYRAAFDYLKSEDHDCIVTMDADLSHLAEDVPTLVAAVADGAEVACGSRFSPGSVYAGSVLRRGLSRAGTACANAVLGVGVADATSGFRAYNARRMSDALETRTSPPGFAFQLDMLVACRLAGGTVIDVPIAFQPRAAGNSKLTLRVAFGVLFYLVRSGVRVGRAGNSSRGTVRGIAITCAGVKAVANRRVEGSGARLDGDCGGPC